MVTAIKGALSRRFAGHVQHEAPGEEVPVGVVVPFDFGLDWEYWRYLPEHVSLYFTRTPYVRKQVGVSMAKDLARPSTIKNATRALSALDPQVTLYACSSGSFVGGLAGEEAIRARMLEAGAKRAVTTSGAMLDALQAVGARRVAIAAPYTERLTLKLVAFLQEAGFDVASCTHLNLDSGIDSVSRATVAELVRDAAQPGVDAVFVSCTALRTYGIVASLEREIGVPVLTANQVSLWGALRAAGAFYRDIEEMAPEELPGGANPMARSTELLLRAVTSDVESRERDVA